MKRTLIALLLIVLTSSNTFAQSVYEKGIGARDKGLTDLSADYFKQALTTADSSAARYQLGLLSEQAEHFAEAAQWFAATDTTGSSMAHLAMCLAELGLWEPSKQAAEKAVELATDKADQASAMSTLSLYYCHVKSFTNAELWANRARETSPNDARSWNAAGIVCFNKGQDNEAIRNFRQALQADPDNCDAYFNLGTMYCVRGNHESAINTLRKGLQRHRNSVKLYHCLGWAYRLRGDKQKAIECYQTVIGLDSMYIDAYNQIGNINYDQGDYERAIAMHRQAAKKMPNMADTYKLIGRAYVGKGDFAAAIRNYQKAAELNNSDGETYNLIADLYAKQNNTKREQANRKRAAKLGHTEAQSWCVKRGIKW